MPQPKALLELLKPITWFAPMWAFLCGMVSSGLPILDNAGVIALGVLLAGPMVCGTSQVVNDWFDRHVDKINQPERPIPSGRVPGQWGLFLAVVWTGLSLVVASFLGTWGFIAACVGLALAWAYSAPPFRVKKSGWWGPATVGLCYEGLPWFTAAAIMANALPDHRILVLALLYSMGAHGIMTLNDFKAVEGDRAMGINSLPVALGVENAALLACYVMALPQFLVFGYLLSWGMPIAALTILGSLGVQLFLMRRLMTDPKQYAPWYNATGTTLFVLGMLVAAFALRFSGGGA